MQELSVCLLIKGSRVRVPPGSPQVTQNIASLQGYTHPRKSTDPLSGSFSVRTLSRSLPEIEESMNRCDREIAALHQDTHTPCWYLAIAEADWQAERSLILEAVEARHAAGD